MDLTPLEDAGWLDPSAPNAADRRAMVDYLVSIGVTVDELREAFEGDYVHAAGLTRLLGAGELSAADVAARPDVGVDPETVVEIYRLLGINLPSADDRLIRTDEAAAVAQMIEATAMFEGGEADEILRATSAALTSLAEAIVSVFVGGVEDRIEGAAVADLERAQMTQLTGELGVEFGKSIGLLFRHHLREAIGRQRRSMVDAPDRQSRTMTVGFVDLVGFTPLSSAMSSDELLAFVRDFESRSFDIASRAGGRIVKTIGDEVMISALDADAGAAIVLDLIADFASSGTAPRGGIASGAMVARQGDFFGPVVNLASRLVDAAVPGEVLADTATADALGDEFGVEPAGRRMLKGFAEPVAVASISR